MKIYDAIAAMESRRPINHKKHVTLDDFLLQEAERGDKVARKLLDAEEIFLPSTERTLRQLRQDPPGATLVVRKSRPDGVLRTSGLRTD